MHKLDLPIDNIEAAAIARRRNRESQRQSRIFNAKTRIIGVSSVVLLNEVFNFIFISMWGNCNYLYV